ncbi:phenylacrylic acid decarboxylase [Cryptococcus deuterogattii 99/473]|uniref:Flavin prenyltransferase PAD1, mitochondrial n=2 Tax=Cryptococcus deuterogattii TaxID=1859096 RepID=A0A0D0V549_9TREE|nr:phenylacrylic acid decarboxylase [Cryptococcus deuterogattii R265]KIR28199.1 phenylacrylic acid decarboxylase [Cryptococcus deuterogattii LA55]KIR33502.1 phenylacrylic acid decarboxylase [Cryptococcus deuterogattii MMRL2647]KIR41754.1 phenylacrylic acid decarboxylase [Cryptococcus deuterogattii Ram5]KIR73421.1 phenylacrylic acid decarboxylase [Cryptococcus deuterogattii CA1014]KIR91756.1 phenylacrylic acid decarboxylase [Cryptococcus deuterogattii CBS 10090]KIR99177.1 phenylacrylic acid de
MSGYKNLISAITSRHSEAASDCTQSTTNLESKDYGVSSSDKEGVPSSRASLADVPFQLIPEEMRRKRYVVAVTGATGATLAIRLLQALRALDIETHLILSKWAVKTLKYETDMTERELKDLADYSYSNSDLAAPPSSGSFIHDGMFIIPCSMKTLAAVRIGLGDELISRSADVCLKEGRKLMLVVRETPLNDIHLENMLFLRRAGAIIFPPVPAYYIRPQTIDDLTNQTVGRILDSMGLHTTGFARWAENL